MKQPPIKRPLHHGKRCPICGKGKLERVFGPETFTYKGHSKTVDIESFHCPACGESFVDDHAARQFEPELDAWHSQIDLQGQRA